MIEIIVVSLCVYALSTLIVDYDGPFDILRKIRNINKLKNITLCPVIAYFKCLCRSKDRLKAMELKRAGYSIRIVNRNPEWKKEANAYVIKLPFIVENGEARPLWI